MIKLPYSNGQVSSPETVSLQKDICMIREDHKIEVIFHSQVSLSLNNDQRKCWSTIVSLPTVRCSTQVLYIMTMWSTRPPRGEARSQSTAGGTSPTPSLPGTTSWEWPAPDWPGQIIQRWELLANNRASHVMFQVIETMFQVLDDLVVGEFQQMTTKLGKQICFLF